MGRTNAICSSIQSEKEMNEESMSPVKRTVLQNDGPETIHELWSTPIGVSRPFTQDFIEKLKEDVFKYVLPRAQKNSVNVWDLPDLPDTMMEVQKKKLELAEKTLTLHSEMPLPPMRIAKGYFRHIHPNAEYRITPHQHGSTLGVGVFYIKLQNANPGNMVFIDPRGGVNWSNQFSPFKRLRLEEGMMVVSPGYLIHYIEPTDYQKPVYQERVLIVSNIHRMYEDWIKVLEDKDNEKMIKSMGGMEI